MGWISSQKLFKCLLQVRTSTIFILFCFVFIYSCSSTSEQGDIIHRAMFSFSFCCYSITVVLIFSLFVLLHPTHPTPSQSIPIVYVHGTFILVFWLVHSSSFHHYLPVPFPLATVSLFHVSMPLVLFCSWVYFIP